jgi:hypothetical protein
MGKTRKKIAEVVSAPETTPETTPVKDKPFDEAEFNQRVLDKKQKEMAENVTTIDAGTGQVTKTGAAEYVEPKKTGEALSNAVQQQPQPQPVNPEPAAPAPGAALNSAIQSNTAAEKTENAVLKAGIDNAETAGQVFEAPKVAEEAKKEAEKMQTQLDVETVNTVNALNEEEEPPLGGNSVTIDAGTGQVTTTGNGKYVEPAIQANQTNQVTANLLASQGANEPQLNQGSIPVAAAAYNAVSGSVPSRPSYDQVATKDQVEKDIANQYKNLDSSIPEAVVEKLGVQDYYPEIGRDIAVGTFTGSRIGSQTIYSGAGGLLPQGLYDARKRALKDAAKTKQAALDKYYAGIDIAAQFKPKFNEIVNDRMDNLLYKKHGGNVSSFLADPESRREFSRLEAVAKNVNHYDAYASSVLKDAADDTKFIDPEQVKNAEDIKRALVEDVDGVLNGEKDLSALFAKAQVYQNMIPQIDKVLDDVLAEGKIGKLPINMRTGGVYDEPKFVEERNQFLQKLNDGTLDQAHYISGFKKFFTGDYERIIDGMVQSGKYSELQKEAAMNYFAGHLQEQVELKDQFVATGALGAMRLAEDKRQFNAEYERKIKEGETPWTVRNNMMSSTNPATGKSIQQEFMDMRKQGLKGEALKNKMLQTARDYGFTGATWDPHTKSVTLKENATTYESSNSFKVNPLNTQSPVMVKVYKKVTKGGKPTWVPTTVTANEVANSTFGMYHYKDGKDVKPFLKEDIAAYKNGVKTGGMAIQPQYYESTWGSVGSQTGKYNPLGTETIGDYSTDRAVNLKHTVGRGMVIIQDGTDPATEKPKYKQQALKGSIFVQSNISDPNGRRTEDEKFGSDKNQFGYTLQGDSSSESSGTVSSSNE